MLLRMHQFQYPLLLWGELSENFKALEGAAMLVLSEIFPSIITVVGSGDTRLLFSKRYGANAVHPNRIMMQLTCVVFLSVTLI